jgi:hypothetical protein
MILKHPIDYSEHAIDQPHPFWHIEKIESIIIHHFFVLTLCRLPRPVVPAIQLMEQRGRTS